MKITTCQINLFIIFFLIILIITLYYVNNNTNKLESFVSSIPTNTNTLPTNKKELNNLIPDIILDDKPINNMIKSYADNLSIALSHYNILDFPITINNDNKLCDSWNTYNNSKYKSKDNQCLIVDGQTERKCLLDSNLVPCSNYYNNININKLNFVDTNQILNTFKINIQSGNISINQNLDDKFEKLKLIIYDIVLKINIETQQKYFIKYNDINLDDKTRLVNKTTDEFEKAENDVNINQMNFSIFLEKNNNNDNKINFYYKIIIGIIITMIIIGILNLIFTEL